MCPYMHLIAIVSHRVHVLIDAQSKFSEVSASLHDSLIPLGVLISVA